MADAYANMTFHSLSNFILILSLEPLDKHFRLLLFKCIDLEVYIQTNYLYQGTLPIVGIDLKLFYMKTPRIW